MHSARIAHNIAAQPINISRYPRPGVAANSTAAPAAADGRITYLGKPFAAWPEIRRALASRSLAVRDAEAASYQAPPATELAYTDVVIVGDADGAREVHEICGELRRAGYNGPILLMTSASDSVSRVLGLENGADAWAAPDGDTRSIVAQIRALLRRQKSLPFASAGDHAAHTIRAGVFTLNSASREVAVGQERVELSRLEFELLWNLVRHADQIMSRERLAELIGYGEGLLEGRALDTLVGRLRHRLGVPHADQIRTIRSVGYMLRSNSLFELIGNVVARR